MTSCFIWFFIWIMNELLGYGHPTMTGPWPSTELRAKAWALATLASCRRESTIFWAQKMAARGDLLELQKFGKVWFMTPNFYHMWNSGWWFFPTPLKNDGVRQLGLWHSQDMKKMFQTTNQFLNLGESGSANEWLTSENDSRFHGEWWFTDLRTPVLPHLQTNSWELSAIGVPRIPSTELAFHILAQSTSASSINPFSDSTQHACWRFKNTMSLCLLAIGTNMSTIQPCVWGF